ncbi:MAG: RICIN domain-containing protein [Myxococcales bacterium]|nr:RICIN domain-containing protein [Myxococcales bacterium]
MVDYFIKSALNGHVIDISGANRANGAHLIAWPQKPGGAENQRWALTDAGGGYYFLQSALNGNVIDIYGGSRENGTHLITWPRKDAGADNQLWALVPAGNGRYFLQSKLNGNVIDIKGASRENGAHLISWPRKTDGVDNQLWTLEPAGEALAPTTGALTIVIPPGKLVAVNASAQSAGDQTVLIKDASGATAFAAQGRSTTGGAFTTIGAGTFTSVGSGVYTVELTRNAGILQGAHAIVHKREPYLTTYVFGTNDGGAEAGDRDFNDLVVTLQVFRSAG